MHHRAALVRVLLAAVPALAGCRTTGPDAGLAERVAAAHGEGFYGERAVHAGFRLESGGEVALGGGLLYEPASGRARLELDGGTVAVFDGERAWVHPADAAFERARFHLLTWPYFLAAPWKLGDPGTRLEATGERPIGGEPCETARLTFDRGVGDTPDDWYVVYVDPDTDLLRALAYVVTYGTPVDEAEEEPHVALYDEYARAGGYAVPQKLVIENWSEASGPAGDRLFTAVFTDVRFAPAPAGSFERPPDSREDALPR